MNIIKQIIKESLLNEIGDASAQPYKWELDKGSSDDTIGYNFKTKGGSRLTIQVSFHLLRPNQVIDLFSDETKMKRSEKLFYINNPHYYWDTEFSVTKHKGEPITISDSKFKSDKVEVFRIMSTISVIIKDFIGHNKVRGFAFRPASDSRSKMFIKYFQQQLPNAKILQLKDSYGTGQPTIITSDESVTYTKGEKGPYEDPYNDIEDDDERVLSLRDKIDSKLNKKKNNNDYGY